MVTQVVNVGVVDDNSRDRAVIEAWRERFQQENNVSFRIRHFEDGAALLEGYRPSFDVIFLDIKMGGIDGMRAATAIRQVDSRVVLIFVTNTAQYATSGYSVNAQSYLLKPVSFFAFQTEMNRCLASLAQLERDSIVIGSGAVLRRVAIADIIYVESSRHRITVHLAGEDLSFSGTLKALGEELEHQNFAYANSGYLVNLQHLLAINGEDAVMSNGDHLKISRSRKKALMEALTNYIGGQLRRPV